MAKEICISPMAIPTKAIGILARCTGEELLTFPMEAHTGAILMKGKNMVRAACIVRMGTFIQENGSKMSNKRDYYYFSSPKMKAQTVE